MERNRHAWKLLMFLFFTVGHAVCGVVIRLTSGTDYTFLSGIKGKPQTILWKCNGNKLVEFENNEPYWYRLESQAMLNTTTGDFTLTKLSKEDSGRYESEIQVGGVIRSSTHDIEVFDAVPKPNVTCEVNNTEAKLVCSVDSSAVYEWNGPDVKGKPGQTITVPKEGSREAVYICIVTNEVSNNSIEFHLKDCFIEAVPKPNVTCEVNDTEVKLVCSVDSSADFKWNGPDVKGKQGQTITVPKEGSREAVYICIVTNEVSNNSREFRLKDCFGGGASSATAVPLPVLITALLVLLY